MNHLSSDRHEPRDIMLLHADYYDYYIMCRCMSAVHKFTDPASAAASEAIQAFQRLLLGAGPGLPLKAAAQQPPGWLGGKTGQDRLKTALAALKDITNAQGKYSYQHVHEAFDPHVVKECCCHAWERQSPYAHPRYFN